MLLTRGASVRCAAANVSSFARSLHGRAALSRALSTAPPPAPAPAPAPTSFTASLFSGGALDTSSLFPFPARSSLSPAAAAELEALTSTVDKFFAAKCDAAANDASGALPPALLAGLRALGVYGLGVPEAEGGLGLGPVAYARMVEVVGRHDLAVAIHLGAHQSIGYKGILLAGTPAQRAKHLPRLASGEDVAAFALTEPSTGSDAKAVKTRATRAPDGSWTISGAKLWISNGGSAALFTVFCDARDADGRALGLTAFLVERAAGGVSHGPPEKKMGIRASGTHEVTFAETRVPAGALLGELGGGLKLAFNILNNGRFGLGATLVGTAKACLEGATAHAAARAAFGAPVASFPLVQAKLAGVAADVYGAESLAYALAANVAAGQADYRLEAAALKVYASEVAGAAADEAVAVLGGAGYMAALPYERITRDVRIFRIFEGTNEILRLLLGGQSLALTGAALKASPVAAAAALLRDAAGATARPRVAWASGALRAPADALERGAAALGAAARALVRARPSAAALAKEQVALAGVADAATGLTVLAAALGRAASAAAAREPAAGDEADLVALLALRLAPSIDAGVAAARDTAQGDAAAPAPAKAALAARLTAALVAKHGAVARPPLGF